MIRKVSKSQARKNAKLAEIKKRMDKRCFFCGMRGYDLCHVLPKSVFGQYYREEWNLIVACRIHHEMFDNHVGFRKMFNSLYERVIQKVKPEDEGRVKKYFGR